MIIVYWRFNPKYTLGTIQRRQVHYKCHSPLKMIDLDFQARSLLNKQGFQEPSCHLKQLKPLDHLQMHLPRWVKLISKTLKKKEKSNSSTLVAKKIKCLICRALRAKELAPIEEEVFNSQPSNQCPTMKFYQTNRLVIHFTKHQCKGEPKSLIWKDSNKTLGRIWT